MQMENRRNVNCTMRNFETISLPRRFQRPRRIVGRLELKQLGERMVMVVVVGVMVVVVVGLFLVGLLLVGLLLVELFLVGLLLVGLFLVGLLLEGLFLVGLLLEGWLWLKELEQVGKAVPVVARSQGGFAPCRAAPRAAPSRAVSTGSENNGMDAVGKPS